MASTIPAGGKDAISQARRRFWRGSSFRCRPVSLFITPAGQVGRGPVTAPREPQVPAVVPAQLSSPGARERSRRLHVTRPQGPAPPGQRHRLRSGLPGVLGPSLRLCSPFLASASAPQSPSLCLFPSFLPLCRLPPASSCPPPPRLSPSWSHFPGQPVSHPQTAGSLVKPFLSTDFVSPCHL